MRQFKMCLIFTLRVTLYGINMPIVSIQYQVAPFMLLKSCTDHLNEFQGRVLRCVIVQVFP